MSPNYQVKKRGDVSVQAWDAFVQMHEHGTFWQTSHWVDYLCAYHVSNVDHSMCVTEQETDAIVGVMVMVRENGTYTPNGGQPLPQPLSTEEGVLLLFTQYLHEREGALFYWYSDLYFGMTHPTELAELVEYRAIVSLDRTEDEMWNPIRKSYRPLITKARRVGLQVRRGSVADLSHMQVHHAHQRGVHRDGKTWEVMKIWLEAGTATLLCVYKDVPDSFYTLEMLGYAVFIHSTPTSAYYASAVYLQKNVAHCMMWEAMLFFRRCQFHSLDLGDISTQQESDKKEAIAFFKTGWGHGVEKLPAYSL